MYERLYPGQFDVLAGMTWDLVQKDCANLLPITPLGSVVKGELHFDELQIDSKFLGSVCVEPEAVIACDESRLLGKLPRILSLTISDKEPYMERPDLTLYSQQILELDTKRRTRSYVAKSIILDESGRNIVLQSNAKPQLRQLTHNDRKAWSTMSSEQLNVFTKHDAEYFIDVAALALRSITKNT